LYVVVPASPSANQSRAAHSRSRRFGGSGIWQPSGVASLEPGADGTASPSFFYSVADGGEPRIKTMANILRIDRAPWFEAKTNDIHFGELFAPPTGVIVGAMALESRLRQRDARYDVYESICRAGSVRRPTTMASPRELRDEIAHTGAADASR